MIISVASGKGGTGKTTIAVNLALTLAETESVCLMDCDVEEPKDVYKRQVKQNEGTIALGGAGVKGAQFLVGCGVSAVITCLLYTSRCV